MRSGIRELGIGGFAEGDILLANEPYETGTHISDTAVYMPIFYEGKLVAFSALMAHWADIGGKTPGGWCPDTTDIHQEGMIFFHDKLCEAGKLNETFMRFILKNVRFPRPGAWRLECNDRRLPHRYKTIHRPMRAIWRPYYSASDGSGIRPIRSDDACEDPGDSRRIVFSLRIYGS